MKKLSLLVGILFFVSLQLNAQVDRIIFWMHGLGGDNAAFSRVATATTFNTGTPVLDYPPRRVWSEQLGYEQQIYSLDVAAGYIQTKIAQADIINFRYGIQDIHNNFIIAHSQGGLVARAVDRLYALNPWVDRRMNGIVTFGTPHQGAQIINSRIENKFPEFVDESCKALLAGYLAEGQAEIEKQNFFVRWFTSSSLFEKVLDPLCKVLSGVAPLAFTDYSQPITNEYKVGAPELEALNNFSSPTHKVAFYGIEDDATQAWRVLHSLHKKPNDYPAFGADDDAELVNAVNENMQKYQAKVVQWQNTYNDLGNQYCSWWQWWWLTGYCMYNERDINERRSSAATAIDAWQRGVNWWVTGNDRFRILTGALTYQQVSTTQYECACDEVDYLGNTLYSWSNYVDNPNDCQAQSAFPYRSCYTTGNNYRYTYYQQVSNPSDGIVTAESARNFPGCLPHHTKEMIGSNHQQMRNDSNTKLRLLELFRGNYGSYFETAAR